MALRLCWIVTIAPLLLGLGACARDGSGMPATTSEAKTYAVAEMTSTGDERSASRYLAIDRQSREEALRLQRQPARKADGAVENSPDRENAGRREARLRGADRSLDRRRSAPEASRPSAAMGSEALVPKSASDPW
ncbi:hypothetical protein GCM10027040_08330 [Halomonas shantousis]